MTAILGISAFFHDAAAALVVDGQIVAAAQEERFSRRKNDPSFPARAIAYCLEEAGIGPGDLDYVGYHEKPLRHFDRLLQGYLRFAPRGVRSFVRAMPPWLGQKLHTRRIIRRGLNDEYRRGVVFAEHHESHAASAFFPSPHEHAAIVTVDGVGEWATASIGVGRDDRVELTHQLHYPHSLGLLYSAFTHYLGFEVNEGEYKMMGLAAHGEPRFADRIRRTLIDLRSDGSFRLDMDYLAYGAGLAMTGERFAALFGAPRREPGAEISDLHRDVAASIQLVTEEAMLGLAHFAHRVTGAPDLCLAGGVALNCVANGRLLREGPFDRVWVQPAAGDAGGALGVALLIWHQLLGHPRARARAGAQAGSLLGPALARPEIEAALKRAGLRPEWKPTDAAMLEDVCGLLERGQVVGWAQGRMEYGPRALGARSILADAREPGMQARVNDRIKGREAFRPFAPAVLREHAHEWFDVPEGFDSPYMLLAVGVRDEAREAIPAVTHVDGSARLQTVDEGRDDRFRGLLHRFATRTGCPLLLNTSFNERGEPIVCSAEDALRCFARTGMDALALGDALLRREDQPAAALEAVAAW